MFVYVFFPQFSMIFYYLPRKDWNYLELVFWRKLNRVCCEFIPHDLLVVSVNLYFSFGLPKKTKLKPNIFDCRRQKLQDATIYSYLEYRLIALLLRCSQFLSKNNQNFRGRVFVRRSSYFCLHFLHFHNYFFVFWPHTKKSEQIASDFFGIFFFISLLWFQKKTI